MWSKYILTLLLAIICQQGVAQDWLHLSKDKILSELETKCQDVKIISTSDTEIRINCNEEDERCRVFPVSYQFRLTDGACTSYLRILPVHNYWAATILELVNQQEGEGSGEELDVDGETLQSDYDFSSYKLHLSLEKEQLQVRFTAK